MMIIPFLDLKKLQEVHKKEILEEIEKVADTGHYILGEKVREFENNWASYCESKYAIGVGNGLDALRLALLAVDIGPGDKVIVPSHTFIATWLAVSSIGAIPVPVDINGESYNLEEENIEKSICERTKAIIPVHMYGNPCNLREIRRIATKYDLYIIEDAAQAHGSIYQNQKIGGFGDLICWSFYPGKNLGALGDGGAITTNSSLLAEKICSLRNYGSMKKYISTIKGINSRLDSIQASILNIYDQHLRNNINLKKPEIPINGNWSCWHLYVVQCSQRNKLQDYLSEKGIQTLIHYPIPPFKQKAYKEFNGINMPEASAVCAKVLSLPICPFMSDSMVEYVITNINDYKC